RCSSSFESQTSDDPKTSRTIIRTHGIPESTHFSASRDSPAYPFLSRRSLASRILTSSHQQPSSHPRNRHADFIIDLAPQAFSRRLPRHPQGIQSSAILG